MGRFHLKDGFTFERLPDGGVRLEQDRRATRAVDIVATHVSAEEWASVVAHVSARGESTHSWRDALELHARSEVPA